MGQMTANGAITINSGITVRRQLCRSRIEARKKMNRRCLVCAILLFSNRAFGQPGDSRADLAGCSEDLRLPAFSTLARSTEPSVTIVVRVSLGDAGRLKNIGFDG